MRKVVEAVAGAVKKVVVKKTTAEEVPSTICPNCEDSGLSCGVCKVGRDDVV